MSRLIKTFLVVCMGTLALLAAAPAWAGDALQPRAGCAEVGRNFEVVGIQRADQDITATWPAIPGADNYSVQVVYSTSAYSDVMYQYVDVTSPSATFRLPSTSGKLLRVNIYGYLGSNMIELCGTKYASLSSPSLPIGDPVPRQVTATFTSASTVVVEWQTPEGTEGPMARTLSFIVTSNPAGLLCKPSPGEFTCTATGALPNTDYSFTVQTVSALGTSSPSVPSAPSRWAPPPADPAGIRIQANTTSATFSWAPAKSGVKARTYEVESIPRTNSCTTTKTSCTVKGLKPGRNYAFAITSTTAAGGSSYIYTKSVKTPVKNPVVKKFIAVATTKVKPEAMLS